MHVIVASTKMTETEGVSIVNIETQPFYKISKCVNAVKIKFSKTRIFVLHYTYTFLNHLPLIATRCLYSCIGLLYTPFTDTYCIGQYNFVNLCLWVNKTFKIRKNISTKCLIYYKQHVSCHTFALILSVLSVTL